MYFIKEMKRVSKNICYFTTPNRYFPFELHSHVPILHWFPKPFFDKVLRIIGQEEKTGDYMNLLGMRDLKRLLKAAGVDNYQIYRNRLFGFTIDFSVVIYGGAGNDYKSI